MTAKTLVMGYHTLGCLGFDALLRHGFDVAAVFTHRDNPHEEIWWDSLAELAGAKGVPVHYPDSMKDPHTQALVASYAPDFIFSFYFRFMIPPEVLEMAGRGALNLHGSLLPRLRGRAPINWALVEGEERTGVTLHHMTARADAGDIVAQRGFPIGPRDTALDLFRRAVEETKALLRDVWPGVRDGTAPRVPQDESRATCRGRRTPEDGRIDWSLPTRRIDGLVRAVTDPFPGAFTFLDGRKLLVWSGEPSAGRGAPGEVIGDSLVATGDGAYRIETCELAEGGRRPVLRAGMRLGETK